MNKGLVGMGITLSTFFIVGLTHANLVSIGTAAYEGADYNLVWDDNNNGNSVLWFDYSKFDEWQGYPDDLLLKQMWVDGLDGNLSYNIGTAYSVTWETDWRLPKTLENYDEQNWDVSYDGSTQTGYNNTYNELGHLFYEELGNLGEYDGSGNPTSGFGLKNTGHFNSLQEFTYWTGTNAGVGERNYTFDFYTGMQGSADDTTQYLGLALRNGQVTSTSPVPEPATILLCGAGIIALLGSSFRRKK